MNGPSSSFYVMSWNIHYCPFYGLVVLESRANLNPINCDRRHRVKSCKKSPTGLTLQKRLYVRYFPWKRIMLSKVPWFTNGIIWTNDSLIFFNPRFFWESDENHRSFMQTISYITLGYLWTLEAIHGTPPKPPRVKSIHRPPQRQALYHSYSYLYLLCLALVLAHSRFPKIFVKWINWRIHSFIW